MTPPENRRLRNVRAWLGDLQPAWTVLKRASIDTLLNEPSSENAALRLAADLTADEIALSPVARNALILLREASGRGLKLTLAGNLPRATVAAMEEAMTWPGHDPADPRRYRRVLNEADFRQLHFLRTAAETAGLAERERGRLRVTTRLAATSWTATQAARFRPSCSMSCSGARTSLPSAAACWAHGPRTTSAWRCGRSRSRRTAGSRRKPSPVYARFPATGSSRRSGTSRP